MLSTIFKKYDIRGKYPSQINEVIVFDIVRKFPMVFGEGATIVVGHDARHSSPSLYKTAIETLQDLNYTVIAVGMITTPMIMFSVKNFKADGGIMITASHNPKEQNGIKIIDKSLDVIGGKELFEKITKFFSEHEIAGKPKKMRILKKETEARKKYAAFLETLFEKKKGREMKVVIDCSNGSAGPVFSQIRFPGHIRPIILNAKPDGNFPAHGPNPLEDRTLLNAREAIRKNKADMGIVVDGDADRIIFLDNEGKRVRPEYVWRLIVGHEKYKRSIITELNVYLITKIMQQDMAPKTKLFLSKVGRISVLRAMRDHNADFGFENSGHFYFKEFFYSDCAMVTLIKAINALQALPYTFAEFIRFLPQTIRMRELDIPAKRATHALYHTISDVFGKDAMKVSFFESISVLFDDAFMNVRISNTEDVVRLTLEGEDEPTLVKLQKKASDLVREMTH